MKEGIISFKPKPRNTFKQQIAEGLKSPGFVAIAKSLSTANAQATGAKPPSKNVINDSIFSSPKPKQ